MNKQPNVSLSEAAATRINQIINEEEYQGKILRILVEGGGCSGFSYKFELDDNDNAKPDDIKITKDGATVVIDPISINYMDGSTIDFVDNLMGKSFQIQNPNATSQCGCGTSFSI